MQDGGELVVGDPQAGCPSPYSPGGGSVALTPTGGPDTRATPGPIGFGPDGELFAADRYCDLVWSLPATGAEATVLLDKFDHAGPVSAIGVDADGLVYALDDEGVLVRTLPDQGEP